MTFPEALTEAVHDHPYPLLFATISGAHLYGFPSPDSDWDLRGVHVLPAREVLGLLGGQDTVQLMNDPRLNHPQMAPYGTEIELDLVTHDVTKFFRLLLKRNGYVLEQLHSPLVVQTSPAHAELRALAARCVTRHHAHHYLGFSANQWRLFARESPRRIKPLLYTFRTLLTGLHLMKTGEIQANLGLLNEDARLPYLDELMDQKRSGAEKEPFSGDVAFFEKEVQRLTRRLQEARDTSHLPGEVTPETTHALSDLLVTVRLKDLP